MDCIARLLAAALLLALPCIVHAGAIKGTVELSAGKGTRNAHGNAYPGRANSLPPGEAPAQGGVDETVLWIEKLPAGMVAPPVSGARPQLEQRQQRFVPRVLAVRTGTTVDFPNRDPIYHNVFSVSPTRRFDLGKYREGQSRSVRFDKAGIVRVFCDIHSDMAAFVIVVPHHLYARAGADGRFALPAVPGGDYVLNVWHPDRGESTVPVHVPDSGDGVVPVRI